LKKPSWVRLPFLLLLPLLFSCAGEPEKATLYGDYYNLARDLHGAGRYDRAEFYYLACLKGDRSRGDCLFNLSLLYLETNRPDKALPYLTELHHRDGENLLVMDNLGVAYSLKEEWDEALAWYGRVLEIFPWDRTALYNGALVQTRKGEGEKSLASLEKLWERDKSYPTAMALWERTGERSPEERLSYLEEAETGEKGEILDLNRKKLDSFLSLERQGEALDLLDILIESDPEREGEYLFTRGILLLNHNQSEEGLTDLREAFRKGYRDGARLSSVKSQLSPSLGEVVNKLESLYFPEE